MLLQVSTMPTLLCSAMLAIEEGPSGAEMLPEDNSSPCCTLNIYCTKEREIKLLSNSELLTLKGGKNKNQRSLLLWRLLYIPVDVPWNFIELRLNAYRVGYFGRNCTHRGHDSVAQRRRKGILHHLSIPVAPQLAVSSLGWAVCMFSSQPYMKNTWTRSKSWTTL